MSEHTKPFGTGEHTTRTPGTGEHTTRTPGTGEHTKTFGTGEHTTRTPGTGEHTKTFGSGEHTTRTPGTGEHTTRAPGIGEHTTRAPGTGDHTRTLGTDLTDRVAEATLGRDLLIQLVRCLGVVSVHHVANTATKGVIQELADTVNHQLGILSVAQIQSVGENVFYNRELIKQRGDAQEAARRLRQMYKRLGINEISFNSALEFEDLEAFCKVFQHFMQSSTPKGFAEQKFPKISVRPIDRVGQVDIDRRLNLARCYGQMVVRMQEALEALRIRKPPNVARIRRAMHRLIDASVGHESLLVGLTRFDTMGGDVAFHAVAVAALAMLMGRRLGLGKTALMNLVISALLHDVGRIEPDSTAVPQQGSQGRFDLGAYELRLRLLSALNISRWTTSLDALERVSVAFECALPVSGAGGYTPSIQARMIAVPCAFDLLTLPPPGRPPLAPDEALRLIMDHAGTRFDPHIVQLFASTVGLHPVGSLVRLSGGQLAVVLDVPADPALYGRPTVKVVRDASGTAADYVVELGRSDEGLRIIEGIDAREQQINVTHFLLA